MEPEISDMVKCKECGLTYRDFKKIGRFGCGGCYESFKTHIGPLLKRIHGSERHVGKVPIMVGKTVKDTRNLQDLKARMEKAIQTEDFEEAARLRDKVKEMEKKGKESS